MAKLLINAGVDASKAYKVVTYFIITCYGITLKL